MSAMTDLGPQKGVVALIDRISRAMSAIASATLLAMTLIVTFEVGSRYLFNSPTIWAWDINSQLLLLLVMLGMAEAYRQDVHVRVDVLTAQLSPRGQAILDVIYAPMFFFLAGVIAWTGWEYFLLSYERNQHASTIFAPPIWPIKFTLPLGATLLFLQGLAKLARDLALIAGRARADGKEPL